MKYFIFIVFLSIAGEAFAQVEHNFEMGPDKTDCHAIPSKLDSITSEKAFQLIAQSTYRFKQEVTFSRYRSPNYGQYLSCDGEKGFLILKMKDESQLLYTEVPKTEWNALTNTNDPFTYLESGTLDKYRYDFLDR